jgi:integrase
MLRRPMDGDLTAWVTDLEPRLAKKLARVGLIPEPNAKPATALGAFLTDFTERRIDVKPATKEVWSQVARNLTDHFGADRDLATITEGDAEDFKMYLIGERLASTTVHKRLQFARMFFRGAMKRKLIANNPFAEVTAKAVMKADRERFIAREESTRLLAACPNVAWQTIVALCRFGGLRCPSEVLTLRWQDIDWERERVRIHPPRQPTTPARRAGRFPSSPN